MKRPWLLPLTPLWAAGSAWKNRCFDRAPAKAHHLTRPVISIGSLSAGGAGKTPFLIALGQALQRNGVAVDVLSRGYGRISTATARVVATGAAADFGDEPLLIAQALHAPVYVAPQRIDAGRLAEADAENHAQLHLLDDGLQHRQLARSLDIVLLTQQDVHDHLLPAGDLREPLRSLRRADVIVLRDTETDALRPVLSRTFVAMPLPELWTITRRFSVVVRQPIERPLAFCGIARPSGFRDALQTHGIATAGFMALRDHVRYDDAVISRLRAAAKRSRADGFVTTAKDAVKLGPPLRQKLEQVGPLAVADVHVQLHNEALAVATALQRT